MDAYQMDELPHDKDTRPILTTQQWHHQNDMGKKLSNALVASAKGRDARDTWGQIPTLTRDQYVQAISALCGLGVDVQPQSDEATFRMPWIDSSTMAAVEEYLAFFRRMTIMYEMTEKLPESLDRAAYEAACRATKMEPFTDREIRQMTSTELSAGTPGREIARRRRVALSAE